MAHLIPIGAGELWIVLFVDATQFINHKQYRANTNGAVCDVECRPMPVAQVKIQKIDDVAIHQSINHVANGATQNQRQRAAKQALDK